MIVQDEKDGRYKTIRTPEEDRQEILESIRSLSPEERKLLRDIINSARKSDSKPFDLLMRLEYEERPCPPDRWLEDPHYFGDVGRGTYAWIRKIFPDVFYKGIRELVITGANRIGKDWCACCLSAYLLHLLLCLKDPVQSYGLATGSNLYLIFMSATQDLAREAMYRGFVEKIRQSPWFQKFGKSIKFLDEEIRCPKGIVIKGAESGDMGVVGLNVCAVVIDEAALPRRVKAVHETRSLLVDRMEAIYQAIRRRIRTTFISKAHPPTLLVTIGSRRFPSDFVNRRIKELIGTKKSLVVDLPLWEAKGRENFSEKTFRVLVGNESTMSRILKEGEVAPPGMRVIEVPEDFRSDFEADVEGSLRDIAGIACRAIVPFFANQGMLQAMIDPRRSHPCRTLEWKINEPLQIEWDKLVVVKDGRIRPILSPDVPRCVAVDFGRVRHHTGFSVGFVGGYKTVHRKDPEGRIYTEQLPVIIVEFVLRIRPVHGEEVKFWEIRKLIFDFIEHGIPIKYAVFDHYAAGDDTVQLIGEQGIDSERIKTDLHAYDLFKAAVYEERVKVYAYRPLIDEMALLEEDPKRRKVDVFTEDASSLGGGHHDTADSVCLLVNRLSRDFRVSDFQFVPPEFDVPDRSSVGALYPAVGVGATPFEYTPDEVRHMDLGMATGGEPPLVGYGIVANGREIGWGTAQDVRESKDPDRIIVGPSGQLLVRIEDLAEEFARKVCIERVQFVRMDQVKSFLFEKRLTEPRLADAVKAHIERVWSKPVS